MIGALRLHQCYESQKQFNRYIGKRCTGIGTILAIDALEHPLYNRCITIAIQEIMDTSTPWHATSITLQLYTKHQHTRSLLVCDTIALDNLIFKEPSNKDYALYLAKEGIHNPIYT